MATVDLSTPSAPDLLDMAPTLGNAFGLGILNHRVAVGSWSALELYDVSDPSHIERCGWDNTQTWAMGADIKSYGNEVLVVVADWRGMSTYLASPDSGPDINVYPQYLDFGEVTTSKEVTLVVKNTGTSRLDVNIGNIPAGIEVTPSSFSVGAAGSKWINVKATGPYNVFDFMLYNSNDPDEPSVRQYVYKNNASFPQVGSEAPDFTLQDVDGFWHTLSDYLGKVVYLEFGALW
jgi:hypothetical protein